MLERFSLLFYSSPSLFITYANPRTYLCLPVIPHFNFPVPHTVVPAETVTISWMYSHFSSCLTNYKTLVDWHMTICVVCYEAWNCEVRKVHHERPSFSAPKFRSCVFFKFPKMSRIFLICYFLKLLHIFIMLHAKKF